MPHEHSDNKAKRHKRQTRACIQIWRVQYTTQNDTVTEEPETDAATLTSIGAGLADPHTVLSLTTPVTTKSVAKVRGYRARVQAPWYAIESTDPWNRVVMPNVVGH